MTDEEFIQDIAQRLGAQEIQVPWDAIALGRTPWECKASPVERCLFNFKTDPALDECLVCQEPDERK